MLSTVQVLPHWVSNGAHWFWQLPRLQTWVPVQALPQLPQLFGSVSVRMQTPLQSEKLLLGQLQVLLAQVPPVQVSPQPPQLAESLAVFTQRPLQRVKPVGHAVWHMLLTQLLPAAQAVPHAPQLFGSLVVSTQAPLQVT
jgi:hypothetical protein